MAIALGIHPFFGHAPTAELAIKDAIASANEWLATHQWHTPDGGLAYTVVPGPLTPQDRYAGYLYVLFVVGPMGPSV